MSWARNRRTPTRTQRFIGANAGNSTGRESYEFGTPVVVRDGNAVHRAKGQLSKESQSVSMIQARREGIKKFIHAEACEMQTTETYLGLLQERGKKRGAATKECIDNCSTETST